MILLSWLGSKIWLWVEWGSAAFRGLACLSWLSPKHADGLWGSRGRRRRRAQNFPSPSSPFDTLTPTIGIETPNAFASSHLSLYNPSASSLGKGYLEIALVWWSEWETCKTQTQTISWNPEAFQNCSLTHWIPYLGLENIPALTKSHHSSTWDPKTPVDINAGERTLIIWG